MGLSFTIAAGPRQLSDNKLEGSKTLLTVVPELLPSICSLLTSVTRFPSGFVPSVFTAKMMNVFLILSMLGTCPSNLIILGFITLPVRM
jgi:hypothetical protein